MLFTTSWDDGPALDLRTAELLDQYGCKGTFYVCPRKQHGNTVLSKKEIQELRLHHDIGAHTLRHPKLTEVSRIEAKAEIVDSKAWIEDCTQTSCTMFCYPYGMYNEEIIQLVQEAGYAGARTTEKLQFGVEDPFRMPTTLQISPFPKRKVWSRWWHPLDPHGPLRVQRKQLKKLGVRPTCKTTWLQHAISLFDLALSPPNPNPNPIFHLWGHSHEIERYGMWKDLEAFLAHVQKANVECVTNPVALHALTSSDKIT